MSMVNYISEGDVHRQKKVLKLYFQRYFRDNARIGCKRYSHALQSKNVDTVYE